MTVGQKRRSKRRRAGVGKMMSIDEKTKVGTPKSKNPSSWRSCGRTPLWPNEKNAPVARVTSQEKPENATACEGKKVPP